LTTKDTFVESALELKPGATYVITVPHIISDRVRINLRKYLKREFPKNRFLILDGGMKIEKETVKDKESLDMLREILLLLRELRNEE
jgi:hypothetical protein